MPSDTQKHRWSAERGLRMQAAALDASNDGIAVVSVKNQIVFVNAAYRQILGIGPHDDLSEVSWLDLMPPVKSERFGAHDMGEDTAIDLSMGALKVQRRDGAWTFHQVTQTETEDGDRVYFARDITERHQLEIEKARLLEELEVAQRRDLVAHLAAGIAHDLENLVAVVSSTVCQLESNSDGSDEALSGLRRIGLAMDAARDMVAGLGRVGRPNLSRSLVDLRAIVQEAMHLLGTNRQRRHGISADLPLAAQPVWANRTDLLQIILNLVFNACAAQADGPGKIDIAVKTAERFSPLRQPDVGAFHPQDAYSMLAVSDTGHGVEMAMRNRLFERYVTTRGQAGTGMGLAVVAGSVRKNGGALWFDSVLGQGTTVTVAWPAEALPSIHTAPGTPDGTGVADLAGHRILVVDDVVEVADQLSDMLEADGAIAIALSDPLEALAELRANPGLWSALVTDLSMPGASGVELARAAALLDPAIPCVLVTALPEIDVDVRQLFRSVLCKPVVAQALIEEVRAAVWTQCPTGSGERAS